MSQQWKEATRERLTSREEGAHHEVEGDRGDGEDGEEGEHQCGVAVGEHRSLFAHLPRKSCYTLGW